MSDYIEREAAINACYDGFADCRDDCADNIRNLPAADVVSVVHGYWIWDGYVYDAPWQCSNCGVFHDADSNYCPNCGARMDGDGE